MSNELTETLIIVGTIVIVVGIAKLATYIMERIKLPARRLPWAGSKQLTPYQQARKNASIEFLQRVVNQRKIALWRLLDSKFITWNEFNELYAAIIKWKDEQLEHINDEAFLFM